MVSEGALAVRRPEAAPVVTENKDRPQGRLQVLDLNESIRIEGQARISILQYRKI